MIGIIGYDTIGKAIKNAFTKTNVVYSDSKYNTVTVENICKQDPVAIFVCLPTDAEIASTLDKIKQADYQGVVVVNTPSSELLKEHDIVYNPVFLREDTANQDFAKPLMLVIGGRRRDELLEIYDQYSIVKADKIFMVDVKTASLIKYIIDSFCTVKISYMQDMKKVAQQQGVDWAAVSTVLSNHPWMGSDHFYNLDKGISTELLKTSTEFTDLFDLELLNLVLKNQNSS